ncbi:c-type cytochrome [Flavobacterium artemisiae]|uniref:C-type cytochrome n=1 Tax=Flavobacterium artemisiae TaxID=2126556 RepID=A0ABW4HFN7_9FLAO
MAVKILSSLVLIFLVSCKDKKIEENKFYEKLDLQKKEIVLENIGKKYFEKNCYGCHANKGAKDNHLENAIQSDKYNYQFLKNFITKQDSLLKNKNKDALALKDWSNNNTYVHNFELNESEIKAILYYLKK